MKWTLLAQVFELETKSRYQRKPNSTECDYSLPKVDYVMSTLRVLDNDHGIGGRLEIETLLPFGSIVEISVDTNTGVAPVVVDGVADAADYLERMKGK